VGLWRCGRRVVGLGGGSSQVALGRLVGVWGELKIVEQKTSWLAMFLNLPQDVDVGRRSIRGTLLR
jgi:hypothetical protein